MRSRRLHRAGFLFSLLATTGPSPAQDVSDKLDLCMSCHGERGVPSSPNVPAIAGRPAEDLSAQLRLFRTGQRENPQMVMAKRLTDAEIQEIAAYFAAQEKPRP